VTSDLEPNTIYEHYKGQSYRIVRIAHDATNGHEEKELVVYESLASGETYVREYSEFVELVQWPNGTHGPRFRKT